MLEIIIFDAQFLNPGCKSSTITPHEEEVWIETILQYKPDLIVFSGLYENSTIEVSIRI